MFQKFIAAFLAVFSFFYSLFGVSFKQKEEAQVKIWQSEFVSPGGNEKTDELKMLFETVKTRIPTVTPCPEKDPYPGDSRIKAIFFDGEECLGAPARVFAYIGYPEGASPENPVPGMVLVHGDGCHAWAEWVQYWVDQGYAAISMDGFAQVWSGPDHSYDHEAAHWTVDPASHLPMDNFTTADKPFKEQWFYYFIADILLSNNILRADERVITDMIGITGISWGGFASSIAISYDDRFAFAAPVYGSGFQDVSLTPWGEVFRGPGVSDVWDAKNLLGEVEMPVTWFNSDHDPYFSADSAAASAAAAQNGTVTFIPGFLHGMLIEQPEVLRFANGQTGLGAGNVTIDALSFDGDRAIVSFTLPDDAKKAAAYVYWRSGPLEYDAGELKEDWQVQKGVVLGNNANIRIPADAQMFYVLIEGKTGNIFAGKPIYASSGIFTCNALNAGT
ncbi:MAG: hypothetical protein IJK40_09585 [Clostridia bacterium]|nr:hypothetical protein [Clostridia bacterium]